MEDDGDDKDDSKRRTRNMSEKKRRDQFNLLVNELSTMVSPSNRKMDKSTVLKSTISFLKNHNEITVKSRAYDVQDDWKPAFLSNEEFTYLVLEAFEGFVMVFSTSGQIHYVSESIASLLGYNVADVVNKSIFDLVFEEDRPNLYNILQGPGTADEPIQNMGQDNEIRFQCHLRRGTLDFRDEISYELIEFYGHFRPNTEQPENEDMTYQPNHESRLLFVCTGRLYTPQLIRDVSLADSSRSEFTSRHSLEWKFLFLDHRAPPIIGYLPFEVLGTSGYDYYHFDDLEKVIDCHEALMQKGELTSCYYRFLTKGQQWIWLQTRFYITYHQWNSKPEFVVCTHRVVNHTDVAKSNKEEASVIEMDSEEATQASTVQKESQGEDSITAVMSPSYMSEPNEPYGSYQNMSQPASVKSASAASTGTLATAAAPGTAPPPGVSWPRSCARYASASDTGSARFAPSSDSASVRYAPGSDSNSVRYAAGSDTASVQYAPSSDTTSLSGDSRSSHRNSSREKRQQRSHGIGHSSLVAFQPLATEPILVPQRAIGTQYLEPAPYVNAVGAVGAMGAPGVLPLPSLPVIVTSYRAQIQEQLQQKHEELQQMIVRQQEELRQVKEQLLLARLGILQPLPNVQNPYQNDEMPHNARPQGELTYEEQPDRPVIISYPPQPPPGHPHMPQ